MNYRFVKSKAVFEIFLVVSLIFIVSISLNSYSVVAADSGCCLKAGDQQCQYITKQECGSSEWYPGTCDQAVQCKPGCCDLNDVCMSGLSKQSCIIQQGNFLGTESCNSYGQCSVGCCVIGTQGFLTTEKGCSSKLNELGYDIEMIFEPGVSEVECQNKARETVQGCCISEMGCSQTSSTQCNGQFIYGLCKDVPGKCDNCKGAVQKKCVDGKTEVYNVDSCGEILSVAEPCNLVKGTICDNGKCVDINCASTWDNKRVDYDGVSRKYGESWCEFDSNSGLGIDLPGTRQYKHYCENGKEKVIECKDMREEVCVDTEIDGFRSASCVENKADLCLQCSDQKCCDDIGEGPTGCKWVSDSYSGKCVPYNTEGNMFWILGDETNKKCDLVDNILTTYWSGLKEWDVDSGGEVYTNKFATDYNMLCNVYGDCGAKYDVTGGWSANGFSRSCYVRDRAGLDVAGDPGDVPKSVMDNYDVRSDDGGEFCTDTPAKCKSAGEECTKDGEDCTGALLFQCHDSIDSLVKEKYYPAFEKYSRYVGGMFLGSFQSSELSFWDTKWSALGYIGYGGAVGAGVISALIAVGFVASTVPYAGWIVAGLALAIAGLVYLFTEVLYEHTTREVTIDCNAWEPVSGSNKCSLCDTASEELDLTAGGLHKCTEYMCRSLGKNCEPVETEGLTKCIDTCESNGQRDVSKPFIVPADDMSITCANGQPCEIVSNQNGFEIKNQVQPFTDVKLSFKTCKDLSCKEEEYATCKFDVQQKNSFSGLTSSFDQTSNAFKHTKTLLNNVDVKSGESYNYYMVCQDRCGNPADEALTGFYQIKFNVASGPGPDLMPPQFVNVEPVSGSYVAYEQNETSVKLFIDESIQETINGVRDNSIAGGCRWDIQDVSYLQMNYNMSCPQMQGVGNYQYCNALLNVTNVGTNQYYFRCRDNEGNMNSNSLNGIYTLIKTDPLLIQSVECETPLGTACDDLYYPEFTLKVQTVGGMGIASCGGTESSENRQDFIFSETGTGHSHQTKIGPVSTSAQGEVHTYNIVCNDEAGNIASQPITLNLISDEVAPIIERYYRDSTLFVVETNEWAECYYNGENKFDSADGLKHLTNADKELYVISCKDRFENRVQTINVHLL